MKLEIKKHPAAKKNTYFAYVPGISITDGTNPKYEAVCAMFTSEIEGETISLTSDTGQFQISCNYDAFEQLVKFVRRQRKHRGIRLWKKK
jgi:hypothetical protein